MKVYEALICLSKEEFKFFKPLSDDEILNSLKEGEKEREMYVLMQPCTQPNSNHTYIE